MKIALDARYKCHLTEDIVRIESIHGDTIVIYNITKKYREAINKHLLKRFYMEE